MANYQLAPVHQDITIQFKTSEGKTPSVPEIRKAIEEAIKSIPETHLKSVRGFTITVAA